MSLTGPISRLKYLQKLLKSYPARRIHLSGPIQENEIVLLKSSVNTNADPILTTPLTRDGSVNTKKAKAIVKHSAIIGKEPRDFVQARNGVNLRVFRPSLAEYTDGTPRLVTPIYSQDANFIVSLLDLHPTAPGTEAEKIEIFEAGTGHGTLTVHLARAIHAANTTAPDPESDAYMVWRSNRRAILHTLDNVEAHSVHAAKTIKNFRGGMYSPHIDFHTGCITKFLVEKLDHTSNRPFLDHAILDLPSAELYMDIVSQAVKVNGSLILFVPNITQMVKAAKLVKDYDLALVMQNVFEVGGMVGTGGREWDLRPVLPRALKKEAAARKDSESTIRAVGSLEEQQALDARSSAAIKDTKGWEMVCRPKVGVRVTNGGFVGMWRKAKIYPQNVNPHTGM